MSIELRLVSDLAGLQALAIEWGALANLGSGGAVFSGPGWLLPWWQAYQRVLDAELLTIAGFDGGTLVALAPLYRRTARHGPGLKVKEIRLLGDAGPRPPALDLLVAPGHEEQLGEALATRLHELRADWDVIDLQPLREPSRARAFLVGRLGAAGHAVEASETGGAQRLSLTLGGADSTAEAASDLRVRVFDHDVAGLRKGLAALRRLSRLEWAQGEEHSPLADAEANELLEAAVATLGPTGEARLARLDGVGDEASAACLVIDEGDRAVVVAMAVDPEQRNASAELLAAEARAAAQRGRVSLDVVTFASEPVLPALPSSRQRALRVRVFGDSRSASLARTYGAVRRKVEAARDAPGAAAAGARAAWTKIRSAAETVAGYDRMHLYRGELWTRGHTPPAGLTLALLSEADFDALAPGEREMLSLGLELDVDHARVSWRRGDLAVLARLSGRPAGITWCARTAVRVPELDRSLHLTSSEAYIHDVFVAAQARGRLVAPSMLEFVSRELRARDVYRSWALIGFDNAASVRAFEKAAYVAVADVIYSRKAKVEHISLRPPDPEGRRLLGL